MNTTTENKERVICQGFQVLRLKERITELKLTFGFYDFDKLKELEDEVIALQGYTPSMEKRLEELEEPASITEIGESTWDWQMDPNMPLPKVMGVDRSDGLDFNKFTISTQITAEMLKSFRGSLKDVVENMNKVKLLGHMHKVVELREKPLIRGHILEYALMDEMIGLKHTPVFPIES